MKSQKKEKMMMNISLVTTLIVLLFIIVLISKTSKKSKKNVVDPFIDAKPYHTVSQFELVRIENDYGEELNDDSSLNDNSNQNVGVSNNKQSLVFNFVPPKSSIIRNQIEKYVLVLSSYIDVGNDSLQHIQNQIITRKADKNNLNYTRDGKVEIKINKPSDRYTYYNENNEEKTEDLLYKIGIIIKYPNTYSQIVLLNNVQSIPFNLSEQLKNFSYAESKLYSKYRTKQDTALLTDNIKEKDVDTDNYFSLNSSFEQLKDKVGGYPNSLNNLSFLTNKNGKTIEDHLKDSKFTYNIDANINVD